MKWTIKLKRKKIPLAARTMGCAEAKPQGFEDPERLAMSKVIERKLKQDARQMRKTLRILLLGAGDTGKSTFLKQLNFLHGEGGTDDVTKNKRLMSQNIISCLSALISGCETLNIPLSPENRERVVRLSDVYMTDECIAPQYVEV